jgi:glycosyltransferase involved in cell wall biosynthesis
MDARMVTGHHGIARYTKDLVQGLNEKGHQVSILFHDPQTLEILKGQFTKAISCKLPFAHPLDSLELTQKKMGPYDVVHFPSFSVPLVLPKKSVITIHDLIHWHEPSFFRKIYYSAIVKRALKQAKGIIAVSHWTKRDLVDFMEENTGDKISVIRNGLEEEWFEKPKILKKPERPFFLAISNLKKHKNLGTLLAACVTLWNEGRDFDLYLSLGGDKIVPSKNPKIKLINSVSDEDLRQLMATCTALVSPSIFEGYDYPAAETLSQGGRVILSRGSAHEEFRGPGISFYGSPTDKEALVQALRQALDTPHKPQFESNVPHVSTMVEETLVVYNSL